MKCIGRELLSRARTRGDERGAQLGVGAGQPYRVSEPGRVPGLESQAVAALGKVFRRPAASATCKYRPPDRHRLERDQSPWLAPPHRNTTASADA